jgi:hypothetical protein
MRASNSQPPPHLSMVLRPTVLAQQIVVFEVRARAAREG